MALTPEQRAEIRARYVGWDVCDLVQEIVDLHDGAEVDRLTAENKLLRGSVEAFIESRHQEAELAQARQRNEAALATLDAEVLEQEAAAVVNWPQDSAFVNGLKRARDLARRALTGQDGGGT